MSGSRRPTPAEQHLGDRLSALVDGELGHETRERVLAHLATCAKCKAEADAQRRLKNVFAEAAPPPPSESFLARLQGLPSGGDADGSGRPLGGGGFGGRLQEPAGLPAGPGVFGVRGEPFGYAPTGPHAATLAPSGDRTFPGDRGGFRIHPVGRQDTERGASRGLRFAFAAAGAVSLAAITLGGLSTGVTANSGAEASGGSGTGSNVTPTRSPGTAGIAAQAAQRRRSTGALLDQDTPQEAPVARTEASTLLPPGAPAPGGQDASQVRALTAPSVAGSAMTTPLIPLTETAPVMLTSWPAVPQTTAPGLLSVPVPDPPATPSPTPSVRTAH